MDRTRAGDVAKNNVRFCVLYTLGFVALTWRERGDVLGHGTNYMSSTEESIAKSVDNRLVQKSSEYLFASIGRFVFTLAHS